MTKTTCDDCISQNVCQYKKVYEETTVNSEHPYLLISCTEYRSKIIKPIITDYKEAIHTWRVLNPMGTKMQCHKDTGISRPTIDVYWKFEETDEILGNYCGAKTVDCGARMVEPQESEDT